MLHRAFAVRRRTANMMDVNAAVENSTASAVTEMLQQMSVAISALTETEEASKHVVRT